jgi:hypothetical protein
VPKSGAGVSKLAATLGGMTEGAALYAHNPGIAAGGAVAMAAPYATRAAIKSGAGQAMLATPKYGPGAVGTAARGAAKALGNRAGALGEPAARSYRDILNGSD